MLEIIELSVRGQALTTNKVCVASGLVNEIECHFTTDWDMDEIRAIFCNKTRSVKISVVLVNGKCNVPHEVLLEEGDVVVNLVGSVIEDTELIERMTSYKTKIIEVKQKVNLDGANSVPPTPEVWEQDVARLDGRIDEVEDSIPTKTSDLENDSDFITEDDLPIKEDAPSDDKQYARKNGEWTEVQGGGTGDYENLENKPQINGHELSGNKTTEDLGLFSGDYNDLDNKPEIPSLDGYATEQYVNNGIAQEVTDRNLAIANHHDSTKADKSTTYTKTEVDSAIGNHHDSTKQDTITDLADIRSGAEKGETALQPSALEPYRTSQAQDAIDATKVDKVEGKVLSDNNYTTAEKNKLADLENYDDTSVKQRLTAIEGKESGWDAKAEVSDIPTQLSQLNQDSTHRVVTDTEKTAWNAKAETSDITTAVSQEATARQLADTTLQTNITNEATTRANADTSLQGQIDALVSKSDVVDVVGTYQDLLDYDTSTLGDNDVIKVLTDSTHDNARSYYRWSTETETWTYVGSEAVGYTKAEADSKFALITAISDMATKTWVNAQGFITSLVGYATETWVEAKNYATQAWVEAKGYLTSSALNPYRTSADQDVIDDGKASEIEFREHTADKDNPHDVTKSQLGLGEVENIKIFYNVNEPFDEEVLRFISDETHEILYMIPQGTYSKPSLGIPKTDLASGVQESLDKADTALQQHQSLSNYYTKTQTDSAISNHHDSTKQNVYQAKTVSLPVASWSNKQQTVSVSGVTASNLVQVAPNPSTFTEYCDAQIVCTGQGSGTLTFKCETVPTVAISVNVVIW